MTYPELLDYLVLPLLIPSLGGKRSFTVAAVGNYIIAENSKGSTYQISANDWSIVKKIRAAHSEKPWRSENFCVFHDSFSYPLVYAAALLRHIEGVELDEAVAEFMSGFSGESSEQCAA